jgi:hypothetical protein
METNKVVRNLFEQTEIHESAAPNQKWVAQEPPVCHRIDTEWSVSGQLLSRLSCVSPWKACIT